MDQMLSPKQVAVALGVSESSLKRWADAGKLEALRTVGGHRRIAASEAARFAKDEGLELVRPDVLGLMVDLVSSGPASSMDMLAERLLILLVQGDVSSCLRLVADRYHAGATMSELFDGPLQQTMQDVGVLWKRGRRGIEDEHVAFQTLMQVILGLRNMLRDEAKDWQQRPIAVGGGPEGDPYMIGSMMAAAVLEERGYQAINLGPETPLDVLGGAAKRRNASLVWLACTAAESMPHPSALEELAGVVGAKDGVLVIGGQGVDHGATPTWPHVIVADTMEKLADVADAELESRRPAKAG